MHAICPAPSDLPCVLVGPAHAEPSDMVVLAALDDFSAKNHVGLVVRLPISLGNIEGALRAVSEREGS